MVRKSYLGIMVLLGLYRTIYIQKKTVCRDSVTVAFSLVSLMLILSIPSSLTAQGFPNQPVQLIVPFTAGSGTDLIARAIQPYAERALGVSLPIENAPGADSRIGTTRIYKANPNGYSIGIHGFPTPIIHEHLFNISYKPLNFSFIYAWVMSPLLIFVSEETWKTFDEFLVEAQKRPMTLGIAGFGSVAHLLSLALEKRMNIKFKYVPFSGSAEGFTALAGKHVDANIGAADTALGMVRGKLVRPILLWSFHSDPNFPDVPFAAQYNIPTIIMTVGVFGPPNTPEDRVRVLEKAFSQAAAEPKLAEWAKARGKELIALDAKQFRQEVEKQQTMVKDYKDLLKLP